MSSRVRVVVEHKSGVTYAGAKAVYDAFRNLVAFDWAGLMADAPAGPRWKKLEWAFEFLCARAGTHANALRLKIYREPRKVRLKKSAYRMCVYKAFGPRGEKAKKVGYQVRVTARNGGGNETLWAPPRAFRRPDTPTTPMAFPYPNFRVPEANVPTPQAPPPPQPTTGPRGLGEVMTLDWFANATTTQWLTYNTAATFEDPQ